MNGQESCFNNNDKILGEFGLRVMESKGEGYFIEKHVHNYGHLETVITGSIEITLGDNSPMIMRNGDAIYVPAHVEHTARALQNGTVVHCVFHARDAEGVIDMADHPAFT